MKIIFNSKKFGDVSTIIDEDDYKRLQKLKSLNWCVVKKRGRFYFQKRIKTKLVELHRWIMNEPKNLYIDHINNDTLDNRKQNLRCVKNSTNLRNGKVRSNNSSGVNGVSFDKSRNKWSASIRANYKIFHLGRFNTIKEAEKARKKAEVEFFNI